MEAIPLNGINPHAKIFKPRDITYEDDVLFYPKSIGRNELTDVVAFELIDQTPGKIYDSVESNGFLFSESTEDFINEDEYAIISDCEENGSPRGNLPNGETFVTVALENGDLGKGLNGYEDSYEHESPKIIASKKHLAKEVLFINGDYKKQVTNGSISKVEITRITKKPDNTYIKKISNDNAMKETNHINGEEKNDQKDLLFSYENTSTPNKDYEMKILAGRNDVSLSTSEMERQEKSDVLTEQPKNIFKLRGLSTRIKRSFDDISPQADPNKSMDGIPLEELRNLDEELKQDMTNKINLYPKKPLPVSEFKITGPIPVIPLSQNLQRSLPNSLHGSTESKIGNFKKNSLQIKFGLKDIKRSLSDITPPKDMKRSLSDIIPPKEVDLDVTYLDRKPFSRSRRLRTGRHFPKKKIKDDSFFEIDNRYDEFESNFNYQPIELEMKTIVSTGVPDDDIGILSASTELISPRESVDIFNSGEITSRYISFYRQQKRDCKFITLAFFNVNQPKILNDHLDVPCEVVEQIYTHFIEEIIIYEDEFSTCKDLECSICDDEWFIIK